MFLSWNLLHYFQITCGQCGFSYSKAELLSSLSSASPCQAQRVVQYVHGVYFLLFFCKRGSMPTCSVRRDQEMHQPASGHSDFFREETHTYTYTCTGARWSLMGNFSWGLAVTGTKVYVPQQRVLIAPWSMPSPAVRRRSGCLPRTTVSGILLNFNNVETIQFRTHSLLISSSASITCNLPAPSYYFNYQSSHD